MNALDEAACGCQAVRNVHGRTTDAPPRRFPSWLPVLTYQATYRNRPQHQ